MSAPQTVASKKVIQSRLDSGQCVHCGIQTHTIKKRLMKANKKIPLTIPGKVDHGSCLRKSCQKAGCNVAESNQRPNRISSGAVQQGAGVAATVAGVALSAAGLPGGEVLTEFGMAVSSSAPMSEEEAETGNPISAFAQPSFAPTPQTINPGSTFTQPSLNFDAFIQQAMQQNQQAYHQHFQQALQQQEIQQQHLQQLYQQALEEQQNAQNAFAAIMGSLDHGQQQKKHWCCCRRKVPQSSPLETRHSRPMRHLYDTIHTLR